MLTTVRASALARIPYCNEISSNTASFRTLYKEDPPLSASALGKFTSLLISVDG
jgi:hypothetical protein